MPCYPEQPTARLAAIRIEAAMRFQRTGERLSCEVERHIAAACRPHEEPEHDALVTTVEQAKALGIARWLPQQLLIRPLFTPHTHVLQQATAVVTSHHEPTPEPGVVLL